MKICKGFNFGTMCTYFAKCRKIYFRILKFIVGNLFNKHLTSFNICIRFKSSWVIKILNSSSISSDNKCGNFFEKNSFNAVATALTGTSFSLIEKCGSRNV